MSLTRLLICIAFCASVFAARAASNEWVLAPWRTAGGPSNIATQVKLAQLRLNHSPASGSGREAFVFVNEIRSRTH